MAADNQPPRYDRRRTEAMDTHVLVVRCFHCIRTSNHVSQHVVPTHGAVVLGVDEPIRKESPKHRGITVDQRQGPVVLQP